MVPASAWLRAAADGGRDGEALDAGAARVELARRWLRSFGPAPVSDLQWWGGWTGGQTKAALAALPVAEVDLDGQPGVALADDLEFPGDVAPVATLLPALDPTPMGWQARDWFLGQHRAALFDRTGNIGPTVWWEGRVVGGWAQRASGEVVFRLLEDIGADGAAAVSRRGGPAGGVAGGEPGHPALPHAAGARAQRVGFESICTSMYAGVHFYLWL